MLKSLIAPYRHLGVRFMPTGGVTADNVKNYLGLKEVAAVGGTWLGKADLIAAGEWEKIRATVKAAAELMSRAISRIRSARERGARRSRQLSRSMTPARSAGST